MKESIMVCEGEIEKSVPRDHSLASLGEPRDARQWSLGRIFLSTPHTNDRSLYSEPGSIEWDIITNSQ